MDLLTKIKRWFMPEPPKEEVRVQLDRVSELCEHCIETIRNLQEEAKDDHDPDEVKARKTVKRKLIRRGH